MAKADSEQLYVLKVLVDLLDKGSQVRHPRGFVHIQDTTVRTWYDDRSQLRQLRLGWVLEVVNVVKAPPFLLWVYVVVAADPLTSSHGLVVVILSLARVYLKHSDVRIEAQFADIVGQICIEQFFGNGLGAVAQDLEVKRAQVLRCEVFLAERREWNPLETDILKFCSIEFLTQHDVDRFYGEENNRDKNDEV